jgi:dTDP-4-amino-4,6-dideoxygalactose transaminase
MKSSCRKRIFLSPPHMGGGELPFVNEAFASNYIAPLGPMVDAFEKEFCERTGISSAVAVSSGTAAMHLALRNLGVGPRDEVFASTLTFIGSVTPVMFQGATPVFIDCDRSTWDMDPALLEAELDASEKRGKLPKVVVPTDLYGQCCDYDRVFSICGRYEVPVVVDAAEAMGSKYRRSEVRGLPGGSVADQKSEGKGEWAHAGVGSKAAVFSFNGNKIITTSGGGMLACDDKEFIEKARFLSQQARDPAPHYEHTTIGYNYRMSNIVAAIGRGQLKVLDERVERKREIFEYYRNALGDLPGIEFMPEAHFGKANRLLTVILITREEFGADRESVRLALEDENIESRPLWKPMHLQPVFDVGRKPQGTKLTDNKSIKARAIGGEVAEDLFNRGLCLPSGTAMNEEDLERIIAVIKSCRSKREGRS